VPKPTPPRDVLLNLLDYDPHTGALTWKPRVEKKTNPPQTFNATFAGRRAGNPYGPTRCWQINILGVRYLVHRIVWAMHTGKTVFGEIDHINGDAEDNRLSNLREVSHFENMVNRKKPKHNLSGQIGVCLHKQTGKWRAYITKNGRQVSLGLFASVEEASAARRAAAVVLGYHENHGR
jgi:hypothetical protein